MDLTKKTLEHFVKTKGFAHQYNLHAKRSETDTCNKICDLYIENLKKESVPKQIDALWELNKVGETKYYEKLEDIMLYEMKHKTCILRNLTDSKYGISNETKIKNSTFQKIYDLAHVDEDATLWKLVNKIYEETVELDLGGHYINEIYGVQNKKLILTNLKPPEHDSMNIRGNTNSEIFFWQEMDPYKIFANGQKVHFWEIPAKAKMRIGRERKEKTNSIDIRKYQNSYFESRLDLETRKIGKGRKLKYYSRTCEEDYTEGNMFLVKDFVRKKALYAVGAAITATSAAVSCGAVYCLFDKIYPAPHFTGCALALGALAASGVLNYFVWKNITKTRRA